MPIEEVVLEQTDGMTLPSKRLQREEYWYRELCSVYPYGLNDNVRGVGNVSKSDERLIVYTLLTLGAHARGLQYLSCVSVCVCVCFPYSGTSRNQAYKQQYQRLQRDTDMKYKKGFFFKTLRSEVMASFSHLE